MFLLFLAMQLKKATCHACHRIHSSLNKQEIHTVFTATKCKLFKKRPLSEIMNFIDLKVVARTKANAVNNKQCQQEK